MFYGSFIYQLASTSPHLPTSAVADTCQVNHAPVVQLGSAVAVGANRTRVRTARQRDAFFMIFVVSVAEKSLGK